MAIMTMKTTPNCQAMCKINQGRQQISADKVVVNVQDGIAAAQGNVLLVDAAQSTQSTDGNPRVSLKDSPKGGPGLCRWTGVPNG